MKRSPKRRGLAVGLAVALGLTACGGGGGDEGSLSSCTSEVSDTLAKAAEQAAGVAQYNALSEEERLQLGVPPPPPSFLDEQGHMSIPPGAVARDNYRIWAHRRLPDVNAIGEDARMAVSTAEFSAALKEAEIRCS